MPRSAQMKASRWCITINNPDAAQSNSAAGIEAIKALNQFRYMVYQKEIGAQGTPHYQMYLQFTQQVTLKQLKDRLPTAHCEPQRAHSNSDARKYCMKDNTRAEGEEPHEHGTFYDNEKQKGDKFALVVAAAKEGKSLEEIVEEHPGVCGRYMNNVRQIVIMMKPKPHYDLTEQHQLYVWQNKVLNIVKGNPDPRKIHIVIDRVGNTGKSALCKHIAVKLGGLMLAGTKENMFYLWNGERIVLIDVPRVSTQFFNYSAVEAIKNGFVVSTKYVPENKIYDPPHVIIFTNNELDPDAFSHDRYDYIQATKIRPLFPPAPEPLPIVAPEDPIEVSDDEPEEVVPGTPEVISDSDDDVIPASDDEG